MRRCLLRSFAICGLLFFMAGNAEAQRVLRAEQTFFVKPRVGIAHYHGDLTENFTFAFDNGIPYSLGLELGYQMTTRFSISAQSNYARYTSLDPHVPDDKDRITHQLLIRWTGSSGARVAPFVQAGLHGTDGMGRIALGPSIGFGLDIALTDQVYLFLEAMTNFAAPDDAFDNGESESPGFDLVSYIGPGLKVNFARPFTAVEVLSLECPNELEVGESATFAAATNSAVATSPVSYTWQWEDGTEATGSVATRTFNRPGSYNVTFTASNDGTSDTGSCTINVSEPPDPAEIVTLNASETRFETCEPKTIGFEVEVLGEEPITYQWEFGDGSTGIGEETEHTYTEPGTYTVSLTLTNPHGTTSRSMTITAEPCTAGVCFEITEMNSVFFGRNSSILTSEGRSAIRENVEIFNECPNLCGRIEGFAAPGERNPQELSADRAEAVAESYVENDISTSRFVTEGRGRVGDMTSKKAGTNEFQRVDTIPVQCEDLE